MDDIQFQYFGEDEDVDDLIDGSNDSSESRTARVNSAGQKIRGKDGCFQTVPEPTSQQLYNKIANMKKVLNLSETVENTHDLREKIKEFLEVPDNDIEGYVPYENIQDEKEDEEKYETNLRESIVG